MIYNFSIGLSKESLSLVNEIKLIGELDQNLKEDCDNLTSKIKQQCTNTDKIYFENQNIPLMDEISYVSLQMDQIVNFIEEKDNKHIELDLYRTDYDTISRKQEKLRLSSKTISKAELMDEEVDISEKFYKKAKKEVNDMESNFQNEIDRFQMDKSIFIMRGLKNFIDFRLSVIRSTKKIYEEN